MDNTQNINAIDAQAYYKLKEHCSLLYERYDFAETAIQLINEISANANNLSSKELLEKLNRCNKISKLAIKATTLGK